MLTSGSSGSTERAVASHRDQVGAFAVAVHPIKMDERIVQQIGGALDGSSALREQFRAAHRKECVAENLLRGEVRRHPARVTDRHIGIAGAQVQYCVSPDDLQRDRRLRFPPPRQTRDQPSAGKGIRACHPQRALADARRSRCNCGGEGVEAVPKHRKQSLARARERKRPGAPPEHGLSADVLKQSDLVADRRRRHAELGRGLLEAQMPGGGFEGAEEAKRRELSDPFSLDEFNSPSD